MAVMTAKRFESVGLATGRAAVAANAAPGAEAVAAAMAGALIAPIGAARKRAMEPLNA
jgi:hypothetical protein